MERKRRRVALFSTTWSPWLLLLLSLMLLLVLRSSIVRFISEGGTALGFAISDVKGSAQGRTDSAKATAAAAAGGHIRRHPVKTHCSNTCHKANDGVCDEGRAPSNASSSAGRGPSGSRHLLGVEGNADVWEVNCDLGTDCGDCGPWVGSVPQGWDGHPGPVSWLRAVHNATMFSRRTLTPRPFLAAITHHKADPDVSAMLWHYGAMEGGVTRVAHFILNGQCVVDGGGTGAEAGGAAAGGGRERRRRVVLDAGANFGYYTIQAALYGCRVVAFEPVRKFRAYLDWSVHANGVAELVTLVALALSDSEGALPLVVPRDGSYWGLASIHGANVMSHEARETLPVNATTLDQWERWAPSDFKPSDVLLLKMDLEGWEASVLRGGAGLLASHVENVLTEYSPGIYERNNMSDLAPQTALPVALLALVRSGFKLAHMPTFEFSAPWPPRIIDPDEPLPALEEVTEGALKADLRAFEYRQRMEVDPGGCPLPSELKFAYPVWRSCREWTYGVHPKGFRSAFGFNTNLWATRGSAAARKHMQLKGVAALFDEAQDVRIWTSQKRPGVGIGLVNCSFIGAGHISLFRCTCPPGAPPECGKEQQMVARLAAEGQMPFTGIDQ